MNTRLRVKYSYYMILILDTEQPIVNKTTPMESYRRRWKVVERYYVILRHTRLGWNIDHCRMFRTVLIDGTRKREMEEVNKVQHLYECSHDIIPLLD